MNTDAYYRSQFPTAPFSEGYSEMGPFNNMNMTPFYHHGPGYHGEILRPMTPLMSADLSESEKEFNVHVDLPGAQDLDITIQDRILVIKAERKETHEVEKDKFHSRERQFGKIQRQLVLPLNADVDQAKAVFKDGVLNVRFPKLDHAEGTAKKLTISQA